MLKLYVTVREAIAELPSIFSGGGNAIVPFKSKYDNEFLKRIVSKDENILRDNIVFDLYVDKTQFHDNRYK